MDSYPRLGTNVLNKDTASRYRLVPSHSATLLPGGICTEERESSIPLLRERGGGGGESERERSKRVPMTRENLPATPV